MRYIFFTLLAANIAYFIYGQVQEPPSPEPQATVRYPEGTDTLYLLSENEQGGTGDRAREQANRVINEAVRSDVEGSGDNCLAIGPFEDLVSGQAVVEQLAAVDIPGELRAVDQGTGESDFRVMIPPASSLQDAFRKLRELKSRNIDSYVITQGQDSLGISLGVFSTREAAESARAQHSREGYETTIVEISRLSREFWVFDAGGGDLVISPELWQSLVGDNGALEQRLLACPA